MSLYEALRRILEKPNRKLTGIILFLILFVFEVALIYFWVWPNIIIGLWNWGKQAWYFLVIAGFIDLVLITWIAFAVWYTTIDIIAKIISWYAEEEKSQVEKTIKEFEKEEEIIAKEISEKDTAGLLPTIRYSGETLKTYYKISIKQTSRSFSFSVIAMFMGFFIILFGIASTFGFLAYLFREIRPTDINNIVIAGGVLAEIISALFLWVYNKSSSQLTYFYNRQIQAHNVILAFRIADTMCGTTKDETKREIVKNILETSMTPQPEMKLPSGSGFKNLLKTKP